MILTVVMPLLLSSAGFDVTCCDYYKNKVQSTSSLVSIHPVVLTTQAHVQSYGSVLPFSFSFWNGSVAKWQKCGVMSEKRCWIANILPEPIFVIGIVSTCRSLFMWWTSIIRRIFVTTHLRIWVITAIARFKLWCVYARVYTVICSGSRMWASRNYRFAVDAILYRGWCACIFFFC